MACIQTEEQQLLSACGPVTRNLYKGILNDLVLDPGC